MPQRRPLLRILSVTSAALSLALAACNGDGTGSGGGGDGASGLTAKVDGRAWTAQAGATAQVIASVPGSLLVTGTEVLDGKACNLTLTFYNLRGPGKYALGVGFTAVGGIGQWGEGKGGGGDAEAWMTAGTGLDGEAELTVVGGGRIAGTFRFTAAPGKGSAQGSPREITEGRIDLPLLGTLPALAENLGSTVSAKLNGAAYNAADIPLALLIDLLGGRGVRFSSATRDNALSLELAGVTDTGTFQQSNVQPVRTLIVGKNGGTAATCCWGGTAGDRLEVKVTRLTDQRVQGTFSGTLKPQAGKPATTDLVVTEGRFDIGIR